MSMCLQPFTSYSEILVGNCNFFLHPLHLTPRWGCSHWNSGKKVWSSENQNHGLPGSEDSLTIVWAVSTQYQRVTDGRTDRRPAYSYMYMYKNCKNDHSQILIDSSMGHDSPIYTKNHEKSVHNYFWVILLKNKQTDTQSRQLTKLRPSKNDKIVKINTINILFNGKVNDESKMTQRTNVDVRALNVATFTD